MKISLRAWLSLFAGLIMLLGTVGMQLGSYS